MKKIIHTLFLILLFKIIFLNTVFSSSGNLDNYLVEENKSIKELNESIEILNDTNKELNHDFLILNKDFKLKSFFKDFLAKSEIKDIEYLINKYIRAKNSLEAILEEKAYNFEDTIEDKKILLNEKKDFYKSLLPFIKKEKLKEYLDYIELDVKILKERKDVNEKIIINSEIVGNKVEKIEELIIEHRNFLNEKFKVIIEENINSKIKTLKHNEKFSKLSTELKKVVLNKIIRKIKITISNSENINDRTDTLTKKIEIYKMILEKFEILKESL